MTMISQFLRITYFEHPAQERMLFWYGYNKVYLLIFDKLVHRIHKIIQADKIKLRIIWLQYPFQFTSFGLVFVGQFNIMFMIYIHHMQVCFKQIEDLLQGFDRCSFFNVLEIG